MSIGLKGMEVAAKTLALTAADLLADEALRNAARREFEDARGEGFDYRPLLGERDPPLDYRLAE
jgi:aminobenzoyl-glutamate utilization protein B